MNKLTDNSGAHALDGIDPDEPHNRPRSYRFPEACTLVDDLQELRQLTETDVEHYAGGQPETEKRRR